MLLLLLFALELKFTNEEVDADFFRFALSWIVLNFWLLFKMLWLLKLCVELVA